jgi:hypothetical protein
MMKKTSKATLEEAMSQVTTLTDEQARALRGHAGPQVVDVYDLQEAEREGFVPGTYNGGLCGTAPEFIDEPESPSPAPVFGDTEEYVLFGGSDWRASPSAQTLVEMGLTHVAEPGES